MNIIEEIIHALNNFITTTFDIDDKTVKTCNFDINIDESKQSFGDISSNCTMILAKKLKCNPKKVAEQIIQNFKHEDLEKIEVAGPGFLNLFITAQAYKKLASNIFTQNKHFFKPKHLDKKKINIEFVSANPTGPLHIGHGRGGIIGDVLGNILEFIGHDVTKEFYINDAGSQIKKLGVSFKIRCQQTTGIETQLPDDSYKGEYLLNLAQEAVAKLGKEIINKPDSFFEQYAKEKMLTQLEKTLAHYGIDFDVWFSEKSLHTTQAIDKALELLDKKGYLFKKDNALWFKSTSFGDDKDRVVKKSSGQLTYVSADIAYMENKVERGFDQMIMILGHDHHSYAVRLEGLRQALGIKQPLNVILYQLVKMKVSGKMTRMSKRAGTIVTLSDIIETVGKDVARFFYLHRKADAQLEFDVDLALKKTDENPVYYVQYAYVRTKSIIKKAQRETFLNKITDEDAKHIGKPEYLLIKKIVTLKQMLQNISKNFQTHLLTYFVIDLANSFHSYYNQNRVIVQDKPEQSRGRLLLIHELKETFELCLKLLGISRPEKM